MRIKEQETRLTLYEHDDDEEEEEEIAPNKNTDNGSVYVKKLK